MDSEKSNDPGNSKCEESPPEKILSSGIQLRASARVSKKLKLDQEQALAQAPSPEKKCDPPPLENGTAPEEKRRRRAPVLWSADDKIAFFEALNEHGKNFEMIEKYMIARAKKRGDGGAAKDREKARYFYYRAWQKLSPFVQFPTGVKKVTQELYTLINFGELRKRIGKITEKNAQKLNELIYSGRTQVRICGKTVRIRTPVCPALRRLNKLEEDSEEVKLPAKIEVLLSPRTNKDSIPARRCGHNPRARALVNLNANLNSILTFLSARWPNQGEDLWVGPKIDAVINQPRMKCGQTVNSGSLSLLAHEQRHGGDSAEVQSLLDQLHIGKAKTVRKEKEPTLPTEDIINTEIVDPSVAELPTTSSSMDIPPSEMKEEKDEKDLFKKEEFITRAREGWKLNSLTEMKIGQLYLMLGNKNVIELEYWWTSSVSSNEISKVLERLVSLARLYHYKPKMECHCGHKCKPAIKSGAIDSGKGAKKPVQAKKVEQTAFSTNPLTPNKVDGNQTGDGIQRIEINHQLVSHTFKHPLLPAPIAQNSSSTALDTLKQLQNLRPKYCSRRGRPRARSVVVQRILPLLPKGSQANQPMLVTLLPPPTSSQSPSTPAVGTGSKDDILPTPEASSSASSKSKDEVFIGNDSPLFEMKGEESEISCTGLLNQEREIDVTFPNTNEADPLAPNSFKGILGGNTEGEGEMDDTPPISPTRILKEGEGQWLSSEVTDFSLSSFLGHLESPLKPNGAKSSDDLQISADVDSHFQSLMTESSLDYTAKFADLAEKIAGGAGPLV